MKKTVRTVTAGLSTPQEKIAAIHQYVCQNVTLGPKRACKYINSSLKKVLDDKKGNSAEINLLMASMLDKAGIEAHPVLISTRDHGFIRQNMPVVSQFNYVLCLAKVGDKNILLDATDNCCQPAPCRSVA